MFGNASLPSINYSYFAREPAENHELAYDQLRAAHRYRNNLCEIELARRAAVESALTELFPDLRKIEAELAAADAEVETLLGVAKSANAKSKKLVTDQLTKARIKAAKERRKELYEQRKVARRQAFESPAWTARQDQIEAENSGTRKKAREECGVYWGTYLTVEQSMSDCRSGAPPRFLRWEGEGSLAVQIQGGMSPAEAFSGEDKRLQIDPVAEYDDQGNKLGRCRRGWTTVRMRIGSGGTNGREPVWCAIPVKMHRPIPLDCRIKWVFLHCTRNGLKTEWSVRFVLAREAGWSKDDRATFGTVAMDVGWRVMPEGLRVAYWIGDDGSEGQLVLPNRRGDSDWRYLLDKAAELASVRDKLFNEILPTFANWLDAHKDRLKEESTKRLEHLRIWRSNTRLGFAINAVLDDVRSIDPTMAEQLTAWWEKERHLQRWQLDNIGKFDRQRKAIYREFAAVMSRRYKTLVIEKLDLRKLQREKSVENKTTEDAAMKHNQRAAAVSILRQFLKERFAETVEVSAVDTTRKCHSCGTVREFDRRYLIRTCDTCGVSCDQDRNAALNLLSSCSVAGK